MYGIHYFIIDILFTNIYQRKYQIFKYNHHACEYWKPPILLPNTIDCKGLPQFLQIVIVHLLKFWDLLGLVPILTSFEQVVEHEVCCNSRKFELEDSLERLLGLLYAFWLNNFQLWPEVFASVWVEDLFEVFGLPPLVNDPDEGQGSFAELAENQEWVHILGFELWHVTIQMSWKREMLALSRHFFASLLILISWFYCNLIWKEN